jgi:hypothetical protein
VISELALLPSGRTLRRWDVAVLAYTALFVLLGVVAGVQLWSLADLQRGLLEATEALDLTARAIALLGEVPLVGEGADQLAGSVRDTSAQVRTSAAAAASDIRALAVVVGLAIVLVPVLPVLVLYLPLRLARSREVRGLRRLLAGPPDPLLVEHLARAALRRVPFAELRRVSEQPWRDVEQGRHEALAAAELRRLGLRPPAGRRADAAESRGG